MNEERSVQLHQNIVSAMGQERITNLVKSLAGYLVPNIWRGRKE